MNDMDGPLSTLNVTDDLLHNLSRQLLNDEEFDYLRPIQSGTWVEEVPTVLGLILGFVAITLNCLSLGATSHIKQKLSTHFLLIASLACADILTGISLTVHVLVEQPSSCGFLVIKALHCTGLILCLLHLVGMATDHYIAIIYPLQHPQIMHRKNGTVLLMVFWILGVLLGFSKFYAEAHNISRIQRKFQLDFCQSVWITRYQEEYCLFVIAFITFSAMTYIYIRIYVKIARHKRPGVTESPNSNRIKQSVSPTKHRKALVTTLLILGSFIVCWLPTCIYEVTLIIQVQINPSFVEKSIAMLTTINKYLYNLLLINAVLDPIIYASRLKQIRSGYRLMFRKCCKNRSFTRTLSYATTRVTSTEPENVEIRV